MNQNELNKPVKTKEIRIRCVCLGEDILGLVYYSGKGRYYIFLSNQLTQERLREVLAHEIYHIYNNMPRNTYIIGIDVQEELFETQAANYILRLLRSGFG